MNKQVNKEERKQAIKQVNMLVSKTAFPLINKNET